MSDELDKDKLEEAHCPNCDHNLEEPINDIWKYPSVKAALKDGRSADDIAVLSCPKCGRWGYYNQGSHFWCRFCKEGWYCLAEGEEPPPSGGQYLYLEDGFTSLADTITDVTDGYHNNTQTNRSYRPDPGELPDREPEIPEICHAREGDKVICYSGPCYGQVHRIESRSGPMLNLIAPDGHSRRVHQCDCEVVK